MSNFERACAISLTQVRLYMNATLFREGRSGGGGGSECKKIGDALLHAFDLAAVDHYGRKEKKRVTNALPSH